MTILTKLKMIIFTKHKIKHNEHKLRELPKVRKLVVQSREVHPGLWVEVDHGKT